MLAGIDEPDGGLIVKPAGLTIGYLPQDGLVYSGRTLREEASLAFKPLLDMKAEIAALEDRLGDEDASHEEHETMLSRYSELQDEFRRSDGYTIELKVTTVLRGLGFSDEDLEKKTETFSGGWQMRIALARLLLGRPGLLLLDEPTNHLDLDARNWLEEYLSDYPHAVILVSHDRFFLDAVVTRITEIGMRTLTDYVGNYSAYIKERDARMERLRQQKHDQDEEIERMQAFINRFRYQATKASQVQSRIKMLDKVVRIEIPPERKRVRFHFPQCAKSGRMVLELKHVRKAYGTTRVFGDVNLHIERGDRIALIGPNGVGKSTLMRMLSGVETPDTGERVEGHQMVMQYFAQDEAAKLDPTQTVYQIARRRLADPDGPAHPDHPRRLPLFGGRHREAGARAVGRRAHAAGRRAHAAPAGEHAAARRADQPSRSRLEGRPARRARGLRRHADLRVARPLLRRQARDQGHRDRPRRRVGLPGQLRRVPVEQEAARGAACAHPPPGSGLRLPTVPGSGLDPLLREGHVPPEHATKPDLTPKRASKRRPDPEAAEAVLRRQEAAGRRGPEVAKGNRRAAAANR